MCQSRRTRQTARITSGALGCLYESVAGMPLWGAAGTGHTTNLQPVSWSSDAGRCDSGDSESHRRVSDSPLTGAGHRLPGGHVVRSGIVWPTQSSSQVVRPGVTPRRDNNRPSSPIVGAIERHHLGNREDDRSGRQVIGPGEALCRYRRPRGQINQTESSQTATGSCSDTTTPPRTSSLTARPASWPSTRNAVMSGRFPMRPTEITRSPTMAQSW